MKSLVLESITKNVGPHFEWSTVPTFNSYTKCVGIPGIIRNRPGHGCMDEITIECSFVRH